MPSKRKKNRTTGTRADRVKERVEVERIFDVVRVASEHNRKYRSEILFGIITIVVTGIGIAITLPNMFDRIGGFSEFAKFATVAILVVLETLAIGVKFFPKRKGD